MSILKNNNKKSKKIPRNGGGKVVKNSLSFLLHLKTMHIYCACRYLHPTLHSKSGLVFTLQLNIYDLLAIYKAFPNKHGSDSGGIVVIKKGNKVLSHYFGGDNDNTQFSLPKKLVWIIIPLYIFFVSSPSPPLFVSVKELV